MASILKNVRIPEMEMCLADIKKLATKVLASSVIFSTIFY